MLLSGRKLEIDYDGGAAWGLDPGDQTDPDGHKLAVAPVLLLVPNDLYVPATPIMNTTELRDPSSTKKTPVANPHAGKFRPVRSSYLSNPKYTGASGLAWYILADPADMPVVEVAFLNGQQQPTVESADADFNNLGIQMRGYHDFGVALQIDGADRHPDEAVRQRADDTVALMTPVVKAFFTDYGSQVCNECQQVFGGQCRWNIHMRNTKQEMNQLCSL